MLLLGSLGTVAASPLVQIGPALSLDKSGSSTNWSGFAVSGTAGSITYAGASWVVPAATCAATGTTYSSFWVGIDGLTSSTVEQTGTDSDCHSGTAQYYAWYEFYPNPSFLISGVSVSPGDVIQASVTFSGGVFTLYLQDVTNGGIFQKTGTVSGAKVTSAEFIAEAPALCSLTGCHLASLTNFGTVKFGQHSTGITPTCTVTKSGVTGTLASFSTSLLKIKMVSQSNHLVVKAQPSVLLKDGASFSIKWVSTGP